MPKPPILTLGVVQPIHLFDLRLNHLADDHLGYAVTALDRVRFRAVVDQPQHDFTAIVGVDGAWRINEGDAVFNCQTASGPNLGLETDWQGRWEAVQLHLGQSRQALLSPRTDPSRPPGRSCSAATADQRLFWGAIDKILFQVS